MNPEEARKDFNRLLREHERAKEEWEAARDKLSDRDRLRLKFFADPVDTPDFPPRPRSPHFTRITETPHPHLVNLAARNNQVWVGNYGWMNKQEWEGILHWSEESG